MPERQPAPIPSSLIERGIVRTLPARSTSARTARHRRAGAVLAAAALVGLGLTGCSATSAGSCVQPGDASGLVHASGKFGAPTASFPKPLNTTTVQKSTVKAGSGSTITTGQMVTLGVAHYDGASGESLESGSASLVAGGTSQLRGLQKALLCSTVGSRIVITGTEAELFGTQGSSGNTSVLVLDLKKAYPARADGAPRPGQPGMPTVVLAPGGQPGIKISSNTVPTKLRSAVLRQGSGPVLKKLDASNGVLVNYTVVTYGDPTAVASSSWQGGTSTPVVWPNSGSASGDFTPPSSVVKELVGQRVGSQILVVTPGNEASAFVIDILAVWKQPAS